MRERRVLKSKNCVMQCMDMKSVQNAILQMWVFEVLTKKRLVINVIYVVTSGLNKGIRPKHQRP
jgi:hypothetical protein